MIDKKRLLAISELILAGKIEDMNDEQMREYEQLLIAFIEDFPGEEEKIKATLGENLNNGIDYNELANSLTAMCKTLGKIHADDIARECLKHIGQLKSAGREQVEAYVTSFLSSVAMLSIDIQMAKYLKTKRDAEEKKSDTAETADLSADKTADAQSANVEKTIVAVDDATFPLTVLKKSLQGLPYDIICLNSGREALLYLKQHQPDMFILDIEMPKMDGYELAEKIRELGLGAPIIFLTGNATRRNVMKAVEAGASDFIVKPIDKEKLVSKISKYL